MAHKSHEELAQMLDAARAEVPVGGVYAHYKNLNNTYRVVGHAILESGDEVAVIYEALYDERSVPFVRPLASFTEMVGDVPRFLKVG